jgi:hypothetical protein
VVTIPKTKFRKEGSGILFLVFARGQKQLQLQFLVRKGLKRENKKCIANVLDLIFSVSKNKLLDAARRAKIGRLTKMTRTPKSVSPFYTTQKNLYARRQQLPASAFLKQSLILLCCIVFE